MSTNNCIERRIAEYSQLIESFKEEIKGIDTTGITAPHLPGVGNCYEQAKYKIVFCGWETYGWESLSDFIKKDTEDLISLTDSCINDNEFLEWPSNYHATFWGFVLNFLAKFYKVDFDSLLENEYPDLLHSFIWANSNSMERYEVSSTEAKYDDWEKAKKASVKFDNLNHIINSCSPKLVFILYKNANEDYFLNNSSLSRIYGINIEDKSNYMSIDNQELHYSYYYSRDSRTHIFKLPHPTWIGLYSGIGMDVYLDSIISDIKNYRIWKTLPQSVEDWNKKDEMKCDKSSIEFKRLFIASIAHILTENNLLLKGSELQAILNTNGILTSYGCEYSSEGGRGIFTLIRSVYNYYQNECRDFQTAYEIARSFVNQNGEYAY